ncbi:MAG: GDYXXLXY domain-containing protein [Elusimicrobiota bacterium]|jgi:uncharacterized membrane-anchored protein|nr:GDYXXLXY domain-containing protein [Elusimicrobiota bacterium]
MSSKKAFFILMGLWFLLLGLWTGYKEYRLIGKTVFLKMYVQEERKWFGKNALWLHYEISRVSDMSEFSDISQPENGEQVFVSLIEDGTFYKADKIYSAPPKGLFIKGKIRVENPSFWSRSSPEISIRYPINNFYISDLDQYISQGKGWGGRISADEAESKSNDIYAKVSINSYGNAEIKAIYIDGKQISFK